jgi:hypothetical protein
VARASIPGRQPHPPSLAEVLARWGENLTPRVSIDHPAVSETARDLARTLLEWPTEVGSALEAFAHQMGSDGWTLRDVATWVSRLADVAGPAAEPLHEFQAGIALGQGWSSGVLQERREEGCFDALTGLATLPVLGLRLRQIHEHCEALGVDPRLVYGLVVVDIDVAGRSPLFRDATRVVVADRVASAFTTGETVCETGGPIAVLASRTPALTEQMAELEHVLRSLAVLEETPVLVWLEDLPEHPGLIDQFLLDLAGR